MLQVFQNSEIVSQIPDDCLFEFAIIHRIRKKLSAIFPAVSLPPLIGASGSSFLISSSLSFCTS